MVCATPFGVNVDNQTHSDKSHNNGIKASAASEIVKKTNTSDVSDKNTTKTVKVVVKSVKMSKSDYKVMKTSINKYKSVNGSNPNSYYWKSKALTIYKKDYLDAISRYNKFVKTNKVDPVYVNIFNAVKYVKCTDADDVNKVKKSPSLPLAGELSGVKGLTVLQKYMNRHLNHVNGGPSTFKGVVKSKVGDCWGLAEWAAKQLKANSYKVRIVQGATSLASNHRWVQVRLNGKWINFESSLVTKKYGSKNYSQTCARANTIVKTL